MNHNRWSYEVVSVPPNTWRGGVNVEKLKLALNDMGQKGWELVGIPPGAGQYGHTTLVFRRPQ